MATEGSKKRFERITQSHYALLRSLTDVETLDAKWLEEIVNAVVRDRFALSRGFIKAARMLARSSDSTVRRGAVSRAYYGAYHAARATVFAVERHDQENHATLSTKIDQLLGPGRAAGSELRELRQLREEADYSPYPSPGGTPYDPAGFDGIIKTSIRRADALVRLCRKYLRERR